MILNRLWLLFVLVVPAPVFADSESDCAVAFTLDASHANLLAEAYADQRLTEQEIAAFINHPRSADAIRKTRSFGLDVDRTTLAEQLRMMGAGQPITDRSFGLGRYAQRHPSTVELLNALEDSLPELMASICGRLAPYVPAGSNFAQSLVVVSAVNSSGFTFDDPTQLFLVAEAFSGDQGGFADIALHESYHAVQYALTGSSWTFDDASVAGNTARRLLADTILEGTATHVADPIEAGQEGAMRNFQYRLARRYRRDLQGLFVLFDTTLYRAYHDSAARYDELVGIGLQGNEGFYHLGAFMTRAIAEADGANAIPGYFSKSPVAFFKRYMAISSADPERYPPFSESTRSILRALD